MDKDWLDAATSVASNIDDTTLGRYQTVALVIGLFVAGAIAQSLIDKQDVNYRVLLGEMIFSAIAGVGMYSLGLMQHMSEAQIIFYGALGGIGGWRTLQWVVKIAKSRNS